MADLQHAEASAAATAIKLEALLEAAQDCIYSLSKDLRFTYLNSKAAAYFGAKADLIGRHILEVLPGAGESDFAKTFLKVLHEGGTQSVEAFFAPSGRWYQTSATATDDGLTVFFRDITRQRRAEIERQERLRKSRQEFEAMLDGLPAMVWSAHPDGSSDYTNLQWHSSTGISRNAPNKAEAYIALVHPEDISEVLRVWEHSQASGAPAEVRYRLRHHTGDYRWMCGRTRPELNNNLEVVRWYGTCTDIHDQVLATEALREAEGRLRRAMDHIPQMIWSALPDGAHDYFSPSWYAFTGVLEGTTDGEGWSDLFHPEDQERLWPCWRQSLETGEPYEIKYRLRHHSGDYRWLLGRALAERDDSGQIIRWHGTCTDIHEQVLAEQELEQQRELLQTVIDSASDLIFVKDRQGRFVLVNQALQDGCGISAGHRVADRLSRQIRDRYEFSDQSVISTGLRSETEDTILIRGEERLFETVKVPWVDNGEIAGVIGISRDITNRRQADAALRESEALHRSILEASQDCIEIISLEGQLQLMNAPGACAMEIENVDTVLGQHWPDLWPVKARNTAAAAIEEARAGRPARFTDFCPTAKGTPKWWDVVITPMSDETGEVTRLLCISRDITSTREAADKLQWTSQHDGLTTLPNREAFQAHLQAATLRAMESGGMVGLLLMDLDHFKHVNDTLGHAAGDHLLRTFGERLKKSVRGTDLVARLGGDEFAVILEGVKAPDDLLKAGEGILSRLQAPIRYDGRVLSAGASIGGALFPSDAASAHELFKNADTALYAIKNSGRGGTRMFHNYMREEAQKVGSQLSLARVAISEKSVIPHYQQKIELSSGRIRGFEALLRWHHPSRGIQMPDTVAEAFKDYELASKIGELMQTKVFSDICSWQRAGIQFGRVSINAAPAEFLRDDYAERLLARLAQYQLSGEVIEVEVTEHVFLERGSEYVSRALKVLNESGIRISLDDFGTGYSSLSHLRDFPVDVVKIDRSFISKMVEEPEIRAIVSAVIDLAASLTIEVVAEGIETKEQEEMLRSQRCALGQGFLFGRAVIADEVRVLLARE